MNFSTLAEFRRKTYACFARAADALMDVVDALLTETPAEARRFVSRPIRLPEEVPTLYARRYNLEHGYRTAKQDLLWETPRLRTPEPFARWTDVVSVVRNLLFLARDMVEAHRQPWECKGRACTPEQVRRAMSRIIMQLGTPARRCRPRGYSPGWPSGRPRTPVPTYKVVYKACEQTEKVEKPSSSGVPTAAATMGHKIIRLDPVHGFAAEMTASLVILYATMTGKMVSTTHVISGSIFGVGVAKRRSAVKWQIARSMVTAWVLTIPATALVAALCYLILGALGIR